ncbi:MAG TPA: hydrogenase maturation nickel metallochaperone HypA, partial [Thermoleophilia bacterium]|nr:hydrogenase maturation nickel metallochaperone HypA [Thermoleophilia bacterium]
HEMTLAANVVEEVERCLVDLAPGARVTSVTLEVGALRAVVPEALSFCFEVASSGTRVEGARLVIQEIPVEVHCDRCERQWVIHEIGFLCPACDGTVRLLRGKELLLRAIEVDDGLD